ncbi:hypothetical protein SADUNF_Sadunf08G0168800 [Salix dunnii]|uniref:RING-type E3 ubiquitin transferase n=1 Tax=Salix dunnii TaxID=1413687 RepID=A0A835JYP8_9ROSI|nr:hypothetical protein SADUNF_Sadunf08G0168800 [Salix dunnii]
MESSSLRRSKRQSHEKFLSKAILPAIRGKSCPICLKKIDGEDYRRLAVLGVCLHAYCLDCIRKWSDIKRKCPLCNLEFNYWFCKISLSSRNFSKEKLPVVKEGRRAKPLDILSSRAAVRAGLNVVNRRSRPLPWQRRFEQPLPGSGGSDVIAQRKLQWRASIYNRRLHAVHISSRNCLKQIISRNCCMKQRILHRIEPWIQRELQAILEDPDPSVIVHVASSLFIASLERRSDVQSDQLGVEDHFLQPLRRFLHGWTNMFWHELRCFAESSLTMETYDTVVRYKQSE